MAGQRSRVEEYVRGILRNDRRIADDLESRIVQNESTLPTEPEATALTAADVEAVRKVERGEALSEQEQIRLEAVVLPDLRPAFDIEADSFDRRGQHQ